MAFDVKAKIDEIVTKAKNDPNFMDNLTKDPEKAIESVIGVDIPDGAIDSIITGVKAKISMDKISGIFGKFGK
ncbi:MAG: hypothetical protein MJ133_09265 [Lachnospiraceae bacterium]|nr:hypothetical protein [Lachnospiraceae bacterium]